MSKERARRRREREEAAAVHAARRAEEAERAARRTARRTALTGWVPRPAPGPAGTLAARRRQRVGLVLAGALTLNVLTWLGTAGWEPRAFVLLLSLLATPIVLIVLTRK